MYKEMQSCPLCLNINGAVKVHFFVFLTLVLYGDEWTLSSSGHFPLGKVPQIPI
jgi:hypothetical protein